MKEIITGLFGDTPLQPTEAIQAALDFIFLHKTVKLETYVNNESTDVEGVVTQITCNGSDKLEVHINHRMYNDIYTITLLA